MPRHKKEGDNQKPMDSKRARGSREIARLERLARGAPFLVQQAVEHRVRENKSEQAAGVRKPQNLSDYTWLSLVMKQGIDKVYRSPKIETELAKKSPKFELGEKARKFVHKHFSRPERTKQLKIVGEAVMRISNALTTSTLSNAEKAAVLERELKSINRVQDSISKESRIFQATSRLYTLIEKIKGDVEKAERVLGVEPAHRDRRGLR